MSATVAAVELIHPGAVQHLEKNKVEILEIYVIHVVGFYRVS